VRISARIAERSSLVRLDAARIGSRLAAQLERDLQVSSLASDRPLDAAAHRTALDRLLQALPGRRQTK
jgi:hypothetical protein